AAALLQLGPALARTQHDDGGLDRRHRRRHSWRPGGAGRVLSADRPAHLRRRPAVDASFDLALADRHRDRPGLGVGGPGPGGCGDHGPRPAHRLAPGRARDRCVPASPAQPYQPGLSDRRLRPDRHPGALAWDRSGLAVGDVAALGGGPAGRARHTDCDHLVAAREAALLPLAGQRLALDLGYAIPLPHVIGVEAVEAHRVVPHIVADAFALTVAIDAGEAIDWPAVLEPLCLARAVGQVALAGTAPHHLVFRLGMPIPHPATDFGVEQPRAAVARRR